MNDVVSVGAGRFADRLAEMGVSSVDPMSGGASSLTFSGSLDGRPVVVKVAPAGLPPVLHRDVLRQARIMRLLGPTGVPVPEVLLEDPGAPPEIPPLFIMTRVAGESLEPLFDSEASTSDVSVVADRLCHAARILASLHSIDPHELDLGDQPVVGLRDEVERWCRLLETVDPQLVIGWREIADALSSQVPEPVRPAVVHGDFRLGNLIAQGAAIESVIDWEVWSVGDPRVDLGWFCINADPATYRRRTCYVGQLPGPAELVEVYSSQLGSTRPFESWFVALGLFKSAATWSLIVKHNRKRLDPAPELEAMVPAVRDLLRFTGELAGGDRTPLPVTQARTA